MTRRRKKVRGQRNNSGKGIERGHRSEFVRFFLSRRAVRRGLIAPPTPHPHPVGPRGMIPLREDADGSQQVARERVPLAVGVVVVVGPC
ncbi:hypothetical protein BHM03_00027665 [Ensete ventricosum]|nr:hypothetical protein BHM03_00027665 [Ensete ventricosum]